MYCPNCGTRLETGQRYCSNCGTDLTAADVLPASPEGRFTGEYAGFWRRFAAYIIDYFVLGAVNLVLYFFVWIIAFAAVSAGNIGFGITGVFYVIAAIGVPWLYYAIMESSSKQATLGKMALNIVVTDISGNRISFGRATGRYFAKIISSIIFLIGYIMIAFTQKKQGLHDILSETLVVMKRR